MFTSIILSIHRVILFTEFRKNPHFIIFPPLSSSCFLRPLCNPGFRSLLENVTVTVHRTYTHHWFSPTTLSKLPHFHNTHISTDILYYSIFAFSLLLFELDMIFSSVVYCSPYCSLGLLRVLRYSVLGSCHIFSNKLSYSFIIAFSFQILFLASRFISVPTDSILNILPCVLHAWFSVALFSSILPYIPCSFYPTLFYSLFSVIYSTHQPPVYPAIQ